MATSWLGGSFAPPLDQNRIDLYRALAEASDDEPVKDVVLKLIKMVEVFRETPPSTLPGRPHPTGAAIITPLSKDEIVRIWDHVPWDFECDAYQQLFDTLPARSPLRTPAFHLLWYAKELTKDREPLTCDRL